MKRLERPEEQAKFIELNKRFMDEVEKGASWTELRWLIEEMKEIAKHFEHLEPATVVEMEHRRDHPGMRRER
ncbi:MAG TPA: hypothetical protein VF145_06930 [Chitinophagaceae bacterium]